MANTKISALTSATTPLAGTEVLPVVQSSTTKQVSVANLTAGRAVNASSLSASTGNVEVASTSGYLRVNGQFGGTANGNILVNIGTGQNLIVAETAANIYTIGYGAAGGVPTKITDFEVSTKDTRSYGNFVPNTAAKGINFTANTPAAGMTSQLLNWYEEGTWTPSLGGTTTYTVQNGRYTRIGRVVYYEFQLSILLILTGSTTTISGLPFTAANNSAYGGYAIYYDTIASNVSQIVGYIGTTSINLVSTTSFANSVGPFPIFKNGTNLTFQGFYFV